METAIEKLRNVVNWAGWMNEGFNMKLKSISDIEKVFDYCQKEDIEFVDDLEDSDYYENAEKLRYATEIEKLLGYSLYDVQYLRKVVKQEQKQNL